MELLRNTAHRSRWFFPLGRLSKRVGLSLYTGHRLLESGLSRQE